MTIGDLISIIFAWQVLGGLICMAIAAKVDAGGWEIANPYWCHRLCSSLNWFGAILLSLVYNALCPIGAVCYWFYWICTIGRKQDERN